MRPRHPGRSPRREANWAAGSTGTVVALPSAADGMGIPNAVGRLDELLIGQWGRPLPGYRVLAQSAPTRSATEKSVSQSGQVAFPKTWVSACATS